MTHSEHNAFGVSSKSSEYTSKVFNVILVKSNWKKVVTWETEHDNLILCNFSNSTGSIDE